MAQTATNREVFFRAYRGDHRWQLGRLDGRYCWWSHTTRNDTNYRYVRSMDDLLSLADWFESQGFTVTDHR